MLEYASTMTVEESMVFFMLKGNVLYGQSGGPTAVINSSALGLFLECFKHEEIEKVYACHYGIEGLLKDDLIDISTISKYKLMQLKNTAGAYFGSCRYQIKEQKDYDRILEMFKKYNIRYFFYNGGNDSMDTCNKISKFLDSVNYECRVIGIPKTIDNDLMVTDHTPGFGSALKYVVSSEIELIQDIDSYKSGRVTIIEVMGRNAGWLTASSLYAQNKTGMPHLIYVPERPFDMDDFLNKVNEIYKKEKKCVVAVSEGIKDKNNKLISEGNVDAFGHTQLGGVASYLCQVVEEKLKIKTRYIEMSLLQRCAAHLQSKVDVKEAMDFGKYALKFALKGETDKMVGIKVISNRPYRYKYIPIPLSDVANGVKELDDKYLNKENGSIKPLYLTYINKFMD